MTSAKTESTSIATVLAAPIPAIEDDESFRKLIIYLFIFVIAPP
jgi:multisubunit Na+/H+ antiporter MnhG subunit